MRKLTSKTWEVKFQGKKSQRPSGKTDVIVVLKAITEVHADALAKPFAAEYVDDPIVIARKVIRK
jgi:hypothetical protein